MSSLARARAVWSSGGMKGLFLATRSYLVHHPAFIRILVKGRYRYYRSKKYRALADPFSLVEVDPDQIQNANRDINKYLATGAIRGGEWDKDVTRYANSLKHRSVVQRFQEDRPWKETAVHSELRRRIEETGEADGCFSIEDLERRYDRIDRLYESIKSEGYDPRRSYDTGQTRLSNALDQVCVSIGRDGELIFCGGGNHRLSIAKVIGLESIPVRIVVRHPMWQHRREHVAASNDIPEQLSHPDLIDILEKADER